MKTQFWVYAAVAVLSVGAGVAIAGVPSTVAREPTIDPPADTTTTLAPLDTASASPAPEPTVESTASPSPTDPPASPEPTAPPSSVDDTTADVATTSAESAVAPSTVVVPERSELSVAVVNGAEVGGVAGRTSDELERLGYSGVEIFDGEEFVDVSVIFAVDGQQASAERISADLGIGPNLVFPLDSAPAVEALEGAQLVVYLGRDVESLPLFT